MRRMLGTLAWLVPLACAATMISGCGRESPPAEEVHSEHEAVEIVDLVDDLYVNADQLLGLGQTNAAQKAIADALDDPTYAAEKTRVFGLLIRFLLFTGLVEDAQTRMLAMLRTEPETAQSAFGEIYGHLHRAGDMEQVVAWADTLLAMGLPREQHHTAMGWRLEAAAAAEDDAAVLALVEQLFADFTPEESLTLTDNLFRGLLSRQRIDAIEVVMKRVAAAPDSPARDALLTEMRVQTLVLRERWAEAADALSAALSSLPDPSLHRLFRALAAGAARAGEVARLDALCQQALQKHATLPRTADAAARQWLLNARQTGDLSAIPERIDNLMRLALPPRTIYGLFNRYYYDTANDMPVLKEMMEIGDRLMPLLEDEHSRGALRTLSLDGSFMVDDFDRSIVLLEAGIPGREPEWHKLAIAKVKAHRAMKASQPLEAIQHLRDFMEALKASPEEDTADPTTGIVHTRDMLLGRNTRRIGDLYREANQADEAREAYAEARAFFEQALKALPPDSPSVPLAQQELNDIPAP